MTPFGVNVGERPGVFSVAAVRAASRSRRQRSRVADAGGCDRAVRSAQRQRAILRQPNHAAVRLAGRRRARCGASRSGGEGPPRVSRRRRLGRERVSRPLLAGQPRRAPRLGAHRARAAAAPKCAFSRCRTEVLLPHNEKGRSGFSRLLRHHGRAHLSADPSDGIGASERRRRSCAEYLDPLVEHAGDAVFERRGGTRRRFFPRRGC